MKLMTMALFAALAAARTQAAETAKTADADGQKIFAAKCATCHAKDGKGSPAMAKMLKSDPDKMNLQSGDATKRKDAELIKVVAEGRGKMTAFKGKLTEAEIKAVLAHVRSLAAPAAEKQPAGTEQKPVQ